MNARAFLLGLVTVAMTTMPVMSNAAMVDTMSFGSAAPESVQIHAGLAKQLASPELQLAFEKMGVDAQDIHNRLAQLSAAEQQQLAQQIEQMPAGAGVAGLVGVVFIVLMILELVGITDIFKAF